MVACWRITMKGAKYLGYKSFWQEQLLINLLLVYTCSQRLNTRPSWRRRRPHCDQYYRSLYLPPSALLLRGLAPALSHVTTWVSTGSRLWAERILSLDKGSMFTDWSYATLLSSSRWLTLYSSHWKQDNPSVLFCSRPDRCCTSKSKSFDRSSHLAT